MPRKYTPRPKTWHACKHCGRAFLGKATALYCPRPALCRDKEYRKKVSKSPAKRVDKG